MTTPATTRVLVVGLGSIGQRHARLLSERADIELHLCDSVTAHHEQTRAAVARPATGEHVDYAAALATAPDLVLIATPNHLHVPMGLAAMEAGADVFVEKPVADSAADAARLVEGAARAGRFLHVGYAMRYDDGMCRLKELVEAGAVGELCGGRAMVGTYITLLNAKSDYRQHQQYALVVDYTHEIDYVRWFFGDVQTVFAAGASIGRRDLKPPPNMMQMQFAMQTGALVQIHMDYIQHPQRRMFELYGDRGTLIYDFMIGEIRHYPYGAEHRWDALDVLPIGGRADDLFRRQLADVLERRAAGRSAQVTGADGLAALRVADAAIASAESGANVALA